VCCRRKKRSSSGIGHEVGNYVTNFPRTSTLYPNMCIPPSGPWPQSRIVPLRPSFRLFHVSPLLFTAWTFHSHTAHRAKFSMSTLNLPSQTLIYKRVGNLNIELELYLPPSPHNAPILLWFHGGGLLQGQRKSVAPHMLQGVRKYGYVLISADCK
jgi:acetyl esterase/lipase